MAHQSSAILRTQSTDVQFDAYWTLVFSRSPGLPPSHPVRTCVSSFIDESDDYPVRKLMATCPLQELPISTPVPKTKAPPSATCVAADMIGVSM